MKRTLLVIAAAITLGLVVIWARFTIFLPDGKALFIKEGCVKCHTFRGIGTGPIDISEVSKKWSDDRLRDQITNPQVNKPDTGMPNFGDLSERQVDALIKFLHGKD